MVEWVLTEASRMEIEMRAVGYSRVSDEDQVEGFFLDAQHRAFHDFCA